MFIVNDVLFALVSGTGFAACSVILVLSVRLGGWPRRGRLTAVPVRAGENVTSSPATPAQPEE
jgi:hypothetical protein